MILTDCVIRLSFLRFLDSGGGKQVAHKVEVVSVQTRRINWIDKCSVYSASPHEQCVWCTQDIPHTHTYFTHKIVICLLGCASVACLLYTG